MIGKDFRQRLQHNYAWGCFTFSPFEFKLGRRRIAKFIPALIFRHTPQDIALLGLQAGAGNVVGQHRAPAKQSCHDQ